jgi:hypothetical protein
MGRGSGENAIFAAFEEVSTRGARALDAVSPVELDDAEVTTLRMTFRLMLGDPEARGFSVAQIAAQALPDGSPDEQAEYFDVIVDTAETLVEKGLAEADQSGEEPVWKLTAAGMQAESRFLSADFLGSRA